MCNSYSVLRPSLNSLVYISSPITSSIWAKGAPLSRHTTAPLTPQQCNISRLLYLSA